MKVAFFSTKKYDRDFFEIANQTLNHDLVFFETHLNESTVNLVQGYPVVCVFVNDDLNQNVIEALAGQGCRLIALRCAGFNNVDFQACEKWNIQVVRVPSYSPHAVAEHAVALMLSLNRKIHRAHARVHEGNFALDGLMGFDMNQKCVGIVGTGKIGTVVAQILSGFGCKVIAYDPSPNDECNKMGVQYVPLSELWAQSDIMTLHCPLLPETFHLINQAVLTQMKSGVMLINTSRGAIMDTSAVIAALKTGHVGFLGIDVYEEEGDLFFEDLSNQIIQDDQFSRLLTFPNVLITGHQAFLTKEALEKIAQVTLQNITDFESGQILINEVTQKNWVSK